MGLAAARVLMAEASCSRNSASPLSAKIAATEQRLSELRGELRDIDTFFALWRHFSGENIHPAAGVSIPAAGVSIQPVAGSRKRNSKKEEVADVARGILLKEGRPPVGSPKTL